MGIHLALCGLALSRVANQEKEGWALRHLGLWLVLPPLLTFPATVVKPLYYPRYMVMRVPALVILAARGITHLYSIPRMNYVAAGIVAVILLLSSRGVP